MNYKKAIIKMIQNNLSGCIGRGAVSRCMKYIDVVCIHLLSQKISQKQCQKE